GWPTTNSTACCTLPSGPEPAALVSPRRQQGPPPCWRRGLTRAASVRQLRRREDRLELAAARGRGRLDVREDDIRVRDRGRLDAHAAAGVRDDDGDELDDIEPAILPVARLAVPLAVVLIIGNVVSCPGLRDRHVEEQGQDPHAAGRGERLRIAAVA